MGLFDSLKGLFGKAQDTRDQVETMIQQADSVTDMIPGDADDKLVDGIKQQVENVTDKFDDVTKNLPGQQ